ncbi:hypothetical protein WN72_10800 [Bradyrhizobium arachidis]|uniref:Uncharacterized protein n=2 Tax=Bradyrhizobium arachidis TaxID=858423 RepID=A0AAE7NM88_9BRAD|nr:hypothetical protein WN72_10800 [Bradyrhizobium arachidis]
MSRQVTAMTILIRSGAKSAAVDRRLSALRPRSLCRTQTAAAVMLNSRGKLFWNEHILQLAFPLTQQQGRQARAEIRSAQGIMRTDAIVWHLFEAVHQLLEDKAMRQPLRPFNASSAGWQC